LPPEIKRARKLVGLNADQRHHAAAGANAPCDRGNVDDGVAFVASFNRDVDVGTEHAIARTILDQPVQAGEAVRRYHRAPPLNDVAVIVVMRRLDQNDPKYAFDHSPHPKPNPQLSHAHSQQP
jgi:hypothetical protein